MTNETTHRDEESNVSTYTPTPVQKAGAEAFLARLKDQGTVSGLDLFECLKQADPKLFYSPSISTSYLINEWIAGWDKEYDRYIADLNKNYAEKLAFTQFAKDRVLTMTVKVVDPEQTGVWMRSLYSKVPYLIAGCEVRTIGFNDQTASYNRLKDDLVALLNKHGVMT